MFPVNSLGTRKRIWQDGIKVHPNGVSGTQGVKRLISSNSRPKRNNLVLVLPVRYPSVVSVAQFTTIVATVAR